MRVILSANVPHYYHAARALQKAGYLERYICAMLLREERHWIYRLLPESTTDRLRARKADGLEPKRVISLWLPELLQKGLPRIGLISGDRGNWINNHLYDRMAVRYVTGCDIFHFTSSVGLYSARRAKQQGATIICDQRAAHPDSERAEARTEYDLLGLDFDPPGILYDRKVKEEYDLADYIVVGSSFARRTFVDQGYEPERLLVAPYGTTIHRDGKALPDDGGRLFRIMYAGQIVPGKGVHYLVQAFEELALPDSELVLVGPVGEEMRLIVEGWARRNPNIVVTGSLPSVELESHYRRSSVFVFPSVCDSWGLVVGEAMAAGLPVIVTQHAGSSEMVRESREGFIVPARDVESLKRELMRLYEDRELCAEMGREARRRVEQFSWEKYGERLTLVYEQIARREGIVA